MLLALFIGLWSAGKITSPLAALTAFACSGDNEGTSASTTQTSGTHAGGSGAA